MSKMIKVLVAKPGLDGHDRGAKVIAIALKEAGMEVVYMGLHQTIEAIVQAAIQEDADVIGVSILTGGHVPICRALMQALAAEGIDDILVCVGGVIPRRDFATLEAHGHPGHLPRGRRPRRGHRVHPRERPDSGRVGGASWTSRATSRTRRTPSATSSCSSGIHVKERYGPEDLEAVGFDYGHRPGRARRLPLHPQHLRRAATAAASGPRASTPASAPPRRPTSASSS